MQKNKGFTLIELLVVIAIIGILASVVLAALTDSRKKGTDTSIKSALREARSQAELYYSNNNTYDTVCALGDSSKIGNMVLSARKQLRSSATAIGGDTTPFSYSANGGTTDAADGSAVCHDSATGWAVIVSLKNPTTASSGWCVEAGGISKEAQVLGNGSVVCGS
jgi:prepilin-type N-terminal cleavage/methylation domain-containing protein